MGDVTREGVDGTAAEADAAATPADDAHAVVDVIEREARRWFDEPAFAASEDALACATCVKPYVQKQIMPEFRERAKSRRTAIAPDVEEARALMEVTSAVLGRRWDRRRRGSKDKDHHRARGGGDAAVRTTKTCLSKPSAATRTARGA